MRWRALAPTVAAYAIVGTVMATGLALFEPVAVVGGSMVPVLHHGDLALVRRHIAARRGDIALLRQAGRGAVLHRVARVTEDHTLVMRGDANPIDDFEAASPEEVAGVVVAYLPVGALLERWRGAGIRDTLSAQSDTARR